MSEIPLFILGNPRSGTTLLRRIINAHSLYCVPPECGFVQWLYDKYGHWKQELVSNREFVDSFLTDLEKCRKIETWNLDFMAIG